MYIGHVAVALTAVRIRRGVPLWVLLLASQWPDWTQVLLQLRGVTSAQLYSHSVPAVVGGALLFAVLYVGLAGDWTGAMLIAAVYLTHPLLDLVTGQKPWWAGGPAIGANWYDSPGLDFLLEVTLVALAWSIYRQTFERSVNGRLLWMMLGVLIGCQALLDTGQELRLRRHVGGGDAGATHDLARVASAWRTRI